MTKNEALARKIAHQYNIAQDGSQRKADMLRRYTAVVAKLGYDPML
jgi:hypothetical protein